jgi:transposase
MNDPPKRKNRPLSEPATTARPTHSGRNAGLGPLRSGYALPASPQPRVLFLIDAGFSSCLSRCRVERFNAEGPAGLIGRKPPGNRPKLDDAQRAALVRVVESGPNPVRDGVVRWRLIDLAAWVWDKFGISVSAATLSRELNALGFGKLSARPRHYAQNAEEIAAFKKTSPSGWRKSARRFPRAPQ